MASLQERNGSYRILFSYHGKLNAFTIGKVQLDEAENKARQVDYLLMRLKQRLLVLPEGTDIVTFVEHDGKPPKAGPTLADAPRHAVTLADLKDRYLTTHANGTIEANSLGTCRLHLRHFVRVFGEGFPLNELSLAKMQGYVDHRAKDKISAVTIRKEIATLRAAWNWGERMKLTSGRFPSIGLRYPKGREKPPFMTRKEIDRKIAAGGLGADQVADLWDNLYLAKPEIVQLLAFVRDHATQPFIYPLSCFAAHTGARRSEMLRVLIGDVDFEANVVTIREKKRSKGQLTTRRVPLTPFLAAVLRDWIGKHPGGPYLFCQCSEVFRSKKRSKRTGYQSSKKRPSSLKGRLTGLRNRERPGQGPLTKDEVHDHFKRTLADGAWKTLRGLHTLRHSFISILASNGTDQRLIDEWVGHQTEQQRRRYRHLLPSVQRQAIISAFGQ